MNQDIDKKINDIKKDIKSIKIQGATNVAIATIDGVKLAVQKFKTIGEKEIEYIIKVGSELSHTRENEPLARNFVKFLKDRIRGKDTYRIDINPLCEQYLGMIANTKQSIIEYGTKELSNKNVILTHCHSSTVTAIIINAAKYYKVTTGKDLRVVSTETRPFYQGRKTANELVKAGVDVTQIVDSACASFITNDEYLPVNAVIVGCDELLKDGSFINKVGSFSMALAAFVGKDDFYVATTLLKLDPERSVDDPIIEQRDASEVWDKAPKGLSIINPAFELVRPQFVTGYITEAGILTKDQIVSAARKLYPWIFIK